MTPRLRVLLVEDSPLDAELTLSRLDAAGFVYDVTTVDNAVDFSARLAETEFDIVLADFVLPSFSGSEALALARAFSAELPFVVVSGVLGEEHAVDMLKQGATDYVLKQRLQRLPPVVRRALTERDERRHRIQAQRQLRETETQFGMVIDALRDYAVMTLDVEGRIRTWNAASQGILGYAAHEVIGRSADFLLSAQDRAQGVFEQELAQAQRAGSFSDDRWLVCQDGRTFFGSGVTTAMRDEQGALTGFSKIIRDTTEARIAADALRLAKEQAETANRAKDHFLAVLSHELRTPLTPILAAVRLLQLKTRLPEELQYTLDLIRRNVELEARLIDDLLDLTSIARGKLSLNFTQVDLATLLDSAVDMSSGDIDAKRLRIDRHLRARDTTVRGDAARLQQILWNIVKNAVKFTPGDGLIRIETVNPDPAHVAISVTDTGIGIDADALSRIFSAFEQADESIGPAFGGLGLGLAIAHTLALKHDGTIEATSAGRGHGACFTLTLPLVEVAQVRGSAPLANPAAPVAGRALNVLLVEDNVHTSMAMAQLLEVFGHRVAVADTVGAARRLTDADRYDVLISDIGLPDGSGLDVVRYWNGVQNGAPSIAITGYGMEEDIRRCRDAGFAHHITKPVNFDRLEALLDAIARRPAHDGEHPAPRG
ncbi:MAG: response regulator [Janthinobacterium lividum]